MEYHFTTLFIGSFLPLNKTFEDTFENTFTYPLYTIWSGDMEMVERSFNLRS